MDNNLRYLIIDTDAGVDDAFSVLSALKLSEQHSYEIIGITTCFGNVDVEHATENMAWILDQFGGTRQGTCRVYKGCPSKLISSNKEFEDQHCWPGHGPHGMGTLDVHDQKSQHYFGKPSQSYLERISSEHAAHALVRLAREFSGKLDIVVLGPLTNLALACKLSNTFVEDVGHVMVMGGCSRGRGNASYCAEFNFWSDPEAVHVALETFPAESFSIVPWEFTEEHALEWEIFDQLVSCDTKESYFLQQTCSLYSEMRDQVPKFVLCDVYAMYALLFPKLILDQEHHHCLVETQGKFSRGMLSFDWYEKSSLDKNATLIHTMDKPEIEKLFRKVVGA